MNEVIVDIYSESRHGLPEYARMFDSGMDVRANLSNPDSIRTILPGCTDLIPTGLFVAIPPGYEFQVRPRSGLSLKTKLRVANAPGTIDSPYRGEICIIMENIGTDTLTLADGDRAAQLVLSPVLKCVWNQVVHKSDLSTTDRGEGGFGSTGHR